MGKLSGLKSRLLVSIPAIIIFAWLICFSYHPVAKIFLVLTTAALAGIGVWEYAQLTKAKGLQPASSLMSAVAILEVVAFYVSIAYPPLSKLALLIIVLGFISFFVVHFRKTRNALLHVAVELFGVCYIAVPFSFMLAILYYPPPPRFPGEDGRWWLFYLVAVTKITDAGGYFIGKLFGKHPLAPHLSPKKTIEGAVGGFLFALLSGAILSLLGRKFSPASFHLQLSDALWIGTIIGILAQIGDLAESLLKRDAFVKDSNVLPGLGGVLDMVDSLLFTSPVVYFFVHP